MKVLCSYSSIEFTCEFFPGYLSSRDAEFPISHPIFQVPQKKLLSYLGKWGSGALTDTDSYLLFIAILRSTDLIEFRNPVIRTLRTPALIAQNMERLALAVTHLNSVFDASSTFPRYVINTETRTLDGISGWIDNWEESYAEWKTGYRSAGDSAKLRLRESALQRLIKNPHKPVSAYAAQIADWACLAGSFPTFQTVNRINGQKMGCDDYWKHIIIRCARSDAIYSLNREDLEELIEHCESNIPIGSGIYSHALFKLLRHAHEKMRNFLGIGDLDLSKTTYAILSATDTAEAANLRALIDSAPDHEPRLEEYPSKLAYLRAKVRWDQAKKFGHGSDGQENQP